MNRRVISTSPYLGGTPNGYAHPSGTALHYDDAPCVNGSVSAQPRGAVAGGHGPARDDSSVPSLPSSFLTRCPSQSAFDTRRQFLPSVHVTVIIKRSHPLSTDGGERARVHALAKSVCAVG